MNAGDDDLLTCEFCGELVRRPRKKHKKAFDCPVCGKSIPPPASSAPPPQPVAPIPAEPDIAGTHEDDNNPYGLSGPRRFLCPGCQRELATDAVVCTNCGLNLSTGQRADRAYEVLRRDWTTGLSFGVRLGIFVAVQVLFVAAAVHAWLDEGEAMFLLGAWVGFILLTAFLLGTFDRIQLTRNRRGQVKVTKTWRIGFLPLAPDRIPLEDYGSVSTSVTYEGDAIDWVMFGFYLVFGFVIGGILWWIFHLNRDVCFVRLHNGFTKTLYRGRSHDVMHDIAQTLRNVAGMRAG
jgi:hypothetical protein